jgi:hypothetical protein
MEVLGVAYAGESALGAPVWEKMAEAPAQMGVIGANTSPCSDGGVRMGRILSLMMCPVGQP